MPSFSQRSLDNIAELHPDLQRVCHEAIKDYDFVVICGYRNQADQEAAFRSGNSKARFGQSPHNYRPSAAFDAAPYPIDWNATGKFMEMARVINAAAKRLDVPLRWGGDWNRNGRTDDERFRDLPHFELHPWRDFV